MEFDEVVETVGKAVDATGVAVTLVGVGWTLLRYGSRLLAARNRDDNPYLEARRSIGRAVLLGLEILVAADIIRTVAISPTFESVGVLALIVVVRTFLSFTLEVEISSRWPWQRVPGG